MDYDVMGNPVVYVIYDRSRSGTTTGWWRVAHFKCLENAEVFLEEQGKESYFVSCQQATVRDFGLCRD